MQQTPVESGSGVAQVQAGMLRRAVGEVGRWVPVCRRCCGRILEHCIPSTLLKHGGHVVRYEVQLDPDRWAVPLLRRGATASSSSHSGAVDAIPTVSRFSNQDSSECRTGHGEVFMRRQFKCSDAVTWSWSPLRRPLIFRSDVVLQGPELSRTRSGFDPDLD